MTNSGRTRQWWSTSAGAGREEGEGGGGRRREEVPRLLLEVGREARQARGFIAVGGEGNERGAHGRARQRGEMGEDDTG